MRTLPRDHAPCPIRFGRHASRCRKRDTGDARILTADQAAERERRIKAHTERVQAELRALEGRTFLRP